MRLSIENIKLLGLSRSEVKVLSSLRDNKNTPLLVARHTHISRTTVYDALTSLHKRGLVKSNIIKGKKYWSQAPLRSIENELYQTKKELFNISDGVEEVSGASDSTVIIHRGHDAVRKLFDSIIKNHKQERLYLMQGDKAAEGWREIYSEVEMQKWNQAVKDNKIITEMIFPQGLFERQFPIHGEKWAKSFADRMAVTNEIDEEYFQHGGQIFIFKKSLYLIAPNEEIIIEIRNSEIQKLIKSMFRYIQDTSIKFDVNEKLRSLMNKDNNAS